MSNKQSLDIEMSYGDSSSLRSFTPSPSEGHLPVCDGLDTKGETQDQLPGGRRSPEWAKEELPYPTMCEDGQETGYGRRTVVYGVNGWCSVIKEPDEAEDNCTSLERNQLDVSDIGVSDIGENVEISNSCGSDGNSSSRSDGKTDASQNHNDDDDEGDDGIDDDDDDVEDNDDDDDDGDDDDDDDGDDDDDDDDDDDEDDEDDNDDHNDNGGEDKLEVKHQLKYHKKNHKGWEKCLSCKTVSAVIEEHSKQCKFPGCWVEHCDRNRAENLVPTSGETNRAAIRSIEGKKEDNSEHQAKMKVEEYTEDSCIVALDIAEQYNNTDVGKAAMEGLKVVDLQHASYCRELYCYNKKCRVVKTELEHFRTHQARQCTRCKDLLSVIQHHAQRCQMRGTCRVPGCESNRNHGNVGHPVPRHQVEQKVPALLTCALGRGLTPGKRKSQCQKSTSADDGLSSENPYCGTVLFWHPKRPPIKKVKEDEDYHVQRNQSLGAGVNGTVYPAYWYLESGTREKFAIKKSNFSVEEVKVYEKLEDHPHLVTHYGVAFSGELKKVNIFMELCDGSLFTYMKELNRRLTDKEAMNFFIQVLIAVCYLHSLGIIHKDLKAKNIMLKDNVVKVGDFDTAKILTEEMTEAGLHPRGTRGFAAFEVMAMKPHGRPADVFSLGVLLLELTVGALSDDPKSLVLKIKELEAKYPDLAKLVKACVQKDPMLRPTAASLLGCEIVGNYRSLISDPLPCL